MISDRHAPAPLDLWRTPMTDTAPATEDTTGAWELDSAGLGSSEYVKTIAGRQVTVTFEDDGTGRRVRGWEAFESDKPEASMAAGELTFPSGNPSESDINIVLTALEPQLVAALTS